MSIQKQLYILAEKSKVMKKFYRRKPEVVQAVQYNGSNKEIDDLLDYQHGLALREGDWVCKDKDGYFTIWSNEEFNKQFETV